MLFLGNGKIEEENLPHQTKMTSLILTWDKFKKEQNTFAQDMRKLEGHISYMTDLWRTQILILLWQLQHTTVLFQPNVHVMHHKLF